MLTRKQIAQQAAKIAATSAYNAIMNAKINKTASKSNVKKISVKEIAEIASNAAFQGVVKSAQQMMKPELDWAALQLDVGKSPAIQQLYNMYMKSNGILTIEKAKFDALKPDIEATLRNVVAKYARDPKTHEPERVVRALNNLLFSKIQINAGPGKVETYTAQVPTV
jgi:hypothetical protein